MAYMTGAYGTVEVGTAGSGTTYACLSWSLNGSATEHDVTDTDDEKVYKAITGVKKYTGSFVINFESSTNIPTNFEIGSSVVMNLHTDDSSGNYFWVFSSALITGLDMTSGVDDVIQCTVSFVASGAVTKPAA